MDVPTKRFVDEDSLQSSLFRHFHTEKLQIDCVTILSVNNSKQLF